MKNQEKTPLVDALKAYQKNRPAYFCIPGHRYEHGVSQRWLTKEECVFLKYDLTEVEGLDDLHQPTGVIKEAQELLADLFQVSDSYFLVNGTTCGNEAMLLSTLKEGDKVLVPRNVHKSVMEGLILCGAQPVYFMPEWMDSEGMFGGVTPLTVERALESNPDIKAVFLVNPTYYGIFSDIRKIADICHKRGVVLLVDEAHGAHVYASKRLPDGALQCGADMCTQSFHKVTGSLTQSSVLHVASERISKGKVERALKLVQSTSPSYLLMASLDAARYELANNGYEMMEHALTLANTARKKIHEISGMRCLQKKDIKGVHHVFDVDETRLVISCDYMSGYELQKRLRVCGVETELADFNNVLAIVTYANTQEDILSLVNALEKIASDNNDKTVRKQKVDMPSLPNVVMSPREAFFCETRTVPWEEAEGNIAGEMIAPYPPGVPVICPGEEVTKEMIACVDQYRSIGSHFHGPEDESLLNFKIIEKDL